MLYPIKFHSIYKKKIWGGNKLKTILNKNSIKDSNIGESWEISSIEDSVSIVSNGFLKGNSIKELIEVYMGDIVGDKIYDRFGDEFPLLIKFIDANKDLSIQLHPDDNFAKKHHKAYGKTEMWYIIDVDKNSKIISGLKPNINKNILLQSIKTNELDKKLNVIEVNKNDVFFIPPKHIHSIGEGVLLAEIQQTSDITYRIFDYGRKENGKTRELHLDLAIQNIDFNDYKVGLIDYKLKGIKTQLVKCDYFTTNLLAIDKAIEKDYNTLDSFVIYMCIEGEISIEYNNHKTMLTKGETILIPAEMKNFDILPIKSTKILEVYIN